MSLSEKIFGRKISLSKLFGLSRNENGRVENSIEKPTRKILQNIKIEKNEDKANDSDMKYINLKLDLILVNWTKLLGRSQVFCRVMSDSFEIFERFLA